MLFTTSTSSEKCWEVIMTSHHYQLLVVSHARLDILLCSTHFKNANNNQPKLAVSQSCRAYLLWYAQQLCVVYPEMAASNQLILEHDLVVIVEMTMTLVTTAFELTFHLPMQAIALQQSNISLVA